MRVVRVWRLWSESSEDEAVGMERAGMVWGAGRVVRVWRE